MVAFDIVLTGHLVQSNNLQICKDIMDDQRIKHITRIDRTEAIKRGMGTVNPSNGFVIIAPTGEALLNYIQLMRYLERKGLVRI